MGRPRLYTLNENFFETIDTEDKAYWLGFIYADGYITKSKTGQHNLGIKLSIKDLAHLQKFALDIKTNKPIGIYKEQTQYVVHWFRKDQKLFHYICSCKDTKMYFLNANFICVKTFLQSFLGQNNSFWFRITER